MTMTMTIQSGALPWAIVVATFAALVATAGHARADEPSGACAPACDDGQLCVNGVCMIPAPPRAAPQPPGQADVTPPSRAAARARRGRPRRPRGHRRKSRAIAAVPAARAISIRHASTRAARRRPAATRTVGGRCAVGRRVFLALPFVGTQSYRGDGGQAFSPGLRVGTLLGARFT